jgi:hypothetical protein
LPDLIRRLRKQLRPGLIQGCGCDCVGGKNLAKILVDRAIVINDQNPPVSFAVLIIHKCSDPDSIAKGGKGAPSDGNANPGRSELSGGLRCFL